MSQKKLTVDAKEGGYSVTDNCPHCDQEIEVINVPLSIPEVECPACKKYFIVDFDEERYYDEETGEEDYSLIFWFTKS